MNRRGDIKKKGKSFWDFVKKEGVARRFKTDLGNRLIVRRIGVTPYFYIRHKNFLIYSDISLLRGIE